MAELTVIHVMTAPQLLTLLGIAALFGCAIGIGLMCLAVSRH